MTTTYAQVQDGIVQRVVEPAFPDLSLEEQMAPEIASQMVPLTTSQMKKVATGWLYDGSKFTAPPEVVPEPAPTPTQAELLAQAQAKQAELEAILAKLTAASAA